MLTIKRTNFENQDFKTLVKLLNDELAARDGSNHPLSQFNPIGQLKYVVLAYDKDIAIGCGAIEEYDLNTMEIKRMYVALEARGERIGRRILSELEHWAQELGRSKCLLFTGPNQPEAQKLYERCGYKQISKYGKLKSIQDAICYAKDL